ncbi:MAG: hypothetical protein ACI3X1_07690 [Eubacteriales bacterium]
MNFTAELIEKAKQAKTVEEIVELAKAEGIEMTKEKAEKIFFGLNKKSGELSDNELDNVSGGGLCGDDGTEHHDTYQCEHCGSYNTEFYMNHDYEVEWHCQDCGRISYPINR